jgi:hypothetical protein
MNQQVDTTNEPPTLQSRWAAAGDIASRVTLFGYLAALVSVVAGIAIAVGDADDYGALFWGGLALAAIGFALGLVIVVVCQYVGARALEGVTR